jgi:hypothetical protein
MPAVRTVVAMPRHALALLPFLALGFGPLHAQQALRSESLPTSVMLGAERVGLPGGESMGLIGASLLFDAGNDWGLGPAVYGAASGRRGGFFVGGIEVQRRWAVAKDWTLAAGLFAGGGGGAAAPVGNGLMLRPALTLLKDVGSDFQAGVSWSSVRFPDGHIVSNQLGLILAWRGDFRHYAGGRPGDRVGSGQPTGLGFDRIVATFGRYELTDGSGRRFNLAGARAERRTNTDGLTWGIEAAAAASGDAAGYMEVLGTAAWSLAPLPDAAPSLRLGMRGAAGLGGGGAVPTGGGVLGKVTATLEWRPAAGWTVGAEAGRVHGANGPLRGRHAHVWVGIDLEPGLDGRGANDASVVQTEWSAALQHHARSVRKDGSRRALDTIGLKLNRYVGTNLYLSGQAHSAFGGGAGAYSIGLIGIGWSNDFRSRQRLGAEVLVGAAGGGGIETSGGAIVQGLLWAGGKTSPTSEWRVGAGLMRARGGGLDSPVIEISWSKAFGTAGP